MTLEQITEERLIDKLRDELRATFPDKLLGLIIGVHSKRKDRVVIQWIGGERATRQAVARIARKHLGDYPLQLIDN
jgi:hypothetical protein